MANFTALKTAINNAIKTNGNEEITGAILQAILDAMVETLGDSAINDLEDAITTEVTNRENAVGGVADDLAAEALARADKDNQLDNRINAEEYNRGVADAALSQTMSQGFQTLGSQMTALNAAISALNAAYQNGFLYGGIATPSSSPSNNKCFYIALQGGTYSNFGGVGVVEGINIIKNDSGWKVEHIYDQTTLLNEFYLLRQQVIQAITSFAPIVIEGDVTNAPDEEDLTSNANHLLQFKNNAYSPLEFSGLGRKYLRKNIAPLSESAPFNGFVEGVTAEETLSGTPTQIFWDRMNTRFVGIKDGVYYLDWTDSDNYVPVSTSLVYMYNGTPYQWTGSDFIVDETEVPNLVNCLTQDMINEANTIYIIRYDYTLKEDITIPANCVLQFDGGSISGEHTITGQNTVIEAGLVKIFSTDVTLAGSWNIEGWHVEWFGAKGDGITDDTLALQKCASIKEGVIILGCKEYVVTDTINAIDSWCLWKGGCGMAANFQNRDVNTIIRYKGSEDIVVFYLPKAAENISILGNYTNDDDPTTYIGTGLSVGNDRDGDTIWQAEGHYVNINVFFFKNGIALNSSYGCVFDKIRILHNYIGVLCDPAVIPNKDSGYVTLITFNGFEISDNYYAGIAKMSSTAGTVRAYFNNGSIEGNGAYHTERIQVVTNPEIQGMSFGELVFNNSYGESDGYFANLGSGTLIMNECTFINQTKMEIRYGSLYITNTDLRNAVIPSSFANLFIIQSRIKSNNFQNATNLHLTQTRIHKDSIGNASAESDEIFYISTLPISNATHINGYRVPAGTIVYSNGSIVYRKDDKSFGNIPSGSTKPTLPRDASFKGFMFFDEGLYKPVFFTYDKEWLEADGAAAGILRSGTTSDRPISSKMYIGFRYFDTTLGKPIFVKENDGAGNITWVDSTGATV